MPLVVADAGPLHYLVLTGDIELLPKLFERVLVPQVVRDELANAEAPQAVRDWIARAPSWLDVRPAGRFPQTRHCARPCSRMSLGMSMPMKTILLPFSSPGAHFGPRSLPINWCTPWKMTFLSLHFINSTPL